MLARPRTLPTGFIAPCHPTKVHTLPSGSLWLHEIKHDGFRIIARKDGQRVRLYSRPGNDLIHRFPLIVETLARLRSRSCIIDGDGSLGAFARLAQNEELGGSGGEARGGGRLGKMTRGPKREIIRLTNERDFPHLVELALPPEGFRSILLEIDAFHRDRRIPVRRGRNRHEVKQVYIRFCFPDAATAEAFRNRFGGECLTHAPAVSR